jgi:predicted RNA-binding protein with TRAM domain
VTVRHYYSTKPIVLDFIYPWVPKLCLHHSLLNRTTTEMSSDWSAVELMSRLLVHSMHINSYYEEEQSILNYIMSYGRNSYGGGSYGGRRQSNFGGPKPVEIGKEYDVQVTERSDRGDGVARIQGFVIFVKNGKVGDKAKVKVTSVGNRFAIAEIV